MSPLFLWLWITEKKLGFDGVSTITVQKITPFSYTSLIDQSIILVSIPLSTYTDNSSLDTPAFTFSLTHPNFSLLHFVTLLLILFFHVSGRAELRLLTLYPIACRWHLNFRVVPFYRQGTMIYDQWIRLRFFLFQRIFCIWFVGCSLVFSFGFVTLLSLGFAPWFFCLLGCYGYLDYYWLRLILGLTEEGEEETWCSLAILNGFWVLG